MSNIEKDPVAELVKKEKKFMKEHKDDVYEFFGYFFRDEEEPPIFYKSDFVRDCEDPDVNEAVYPFSPKTLEFCVKRLSQERLLSEASGYDLRKFRAKCLEIAYFNSISDPITSQQEWLETVHRLCMESKERVANYWYDIDHKQESQPE